MAAKRKKKPAPKGKCKVKTKKRVAGGVKTTASAAWKKMEREIAEHFGTTRTGLGQKGTDTREMPEITNWLAIRASHLGLPKNEEPWTHVAADSKCRREIMGVVERWHRFTLTNPEPKLIPVQVTGPEFPVQDRNGHRHLIGMCLLKHLPYVYRAFMAPRKAAWINAAGIGTLFWINRDIREESRLIRGYFEQVEDAAMDWRNGRPDGKEIYTLPLVYIGYPKRIRSAVCFKLPYEVRREIQ